MMRVDNEGVPCLVQEVVPILPEHLFKVRLFDDRWVFFDAYWARQCVAPGCPPDSITPEQDVLIAEHYVSWFLFNDLFNKGGK